MVKSHLGFAMSPESGLGTKNLSNHTRGEQKLCAPEIHLSRACTGEPPLGNEVERRLNGTRIGMEHAKNAREWNDAEK
jgi:hypothetical protein